MIWCRLLLERWLLRLEANVCHLNWYICQEVLHNSLFLSIIPNLLKERTLCAFIVTKLSMKNAKQHVSQLKLSLNSSNHISKLRVSIFLQEYWLILSQLIWWISCLHSYFYMELSWIWFWWKYYAWQRHGVLIKSVHQHAKGKYKSLAQHETWSDKVVCIKGFGLAALTVVSKGLS
jgi:hypothetical protein